PFACSSPRRPGRRQVLTLRDLSPLGSVCSWLAYMYRCQLCGTTVPPGTPCHRLVVQTRPARYPFRSRANCFRRLVNDGKRKKHKDIYTDDPGGTGSQIVREVMACPACASRQEQPTDEVAMEWAIYAGRYRVSGPQQETLVQALVASPLLRQLRDLLGRMV